MNVTELPVPALPATSTDRLMAVADIIEFRPHAYGQGNWWTERRSDGRFWDAGPVDVYGKGRSEHVCGTTACIAGWAVALTPRPARIRQWADAGAEALGLSTGLANYLFSASFKAPAGTVADMLRRIARLPEGERTFSNMPLVLSDRQLRLLLAVDAFNDDDDGPDDDDDDDDDVEPLTVEAPDEVEPEPAEVFDARLLVSV